MHEHEARLERLWPSASRLLALGSRAPGCRAGRWRAEGRRSGEIVVRIEDLIVGYLPGRGATCSPTKPFSRTRPVARIPFLAAQRGRIGIVRPNGAGKTTLLRTIAGDLPPVDGRLTFGNAVQIGYLAQLRGAAFPGTTVLDALLGAIPLTPARRAATLPGSCSVGTTSSRRSVPCPAANARGWSWRCWASCRRTSCCSTSRRTTSTSPPARRSSRSCGSRRPRCSSATTGACWRRSARSCGLSARRGRSI